MQQLLKYSNYGYNNSSQFKSPTVIGDILDVYEFVSVNRKLYNWRFLKQFVKFSEISKNVRLTCEKECFLKKNSEFYSLFTT